MSKIKMTLAAGLAVLGMTAGGASGLFGGVFGGQAQAACAADWVMGDQRVSFCGGALEDGTFTAKLEGDFENGFVSTVTLNDYKGPMFAMEGYGTGFPVNKFVVELEGLSEVTVGDFEYLYMGEMEYELTGEGRLVMKTANRGSSEDNGSSDGALVGSTEDQTKCDDFGAEDAVTWVAVRVGIIGGAVAVVALVAFGVVKLVQEVKKGKKESAADLVKPDEEEITEKPEEKKE